MNNQDLHWNDLIVDVRPSPPALTDAQFRRWLEGREIFVSSRMDDEMEPFRQSVRSALQEWGASPVMWEDVAPSDAPAERSYLDGVDRSSLFVLLIGTRYGAADASGYSPIHKEWNHASDRSIPRLVFTHSSVERAERDGRLNDLLDSMRSRVSTRDFADSEELVDVLEGRLRDLAARQLSAWVKLGQIVFPGRVCQESGERGGTSYLVEATVRDGAVRRAVSGLQTRAGGGVSADRLTWPDQTHPVRVQSVGVSTSVANEADVEIGCALPRNYHGPASGSMMGAMGVSLGGAGPVDQVELWARRALFSEQVERSSAADMLHAFTTPEGPTLPEVLSHHDAHGWVAQGLVRLYAVEGLITRHGGHFERLEVGPVTSSSVPLRARFVPGAGSGDDVAVIEGSVPFLV